MVVKKSTNLISTGSSEHVPEHRRNLDLEPQERLSLQVGRTGIFNGEPSPPGGDNSLGWYARLIWSIGKLFFKVKKGLAFYPEPELPPRTDGSSLIPNFFIYIATLTVLLNVARTTICRVNSMDFTSNSKLKKNC